MVLKFGNVEEVNKAIRSLEMLPGVEKSEDRKRTREEEMSGGKNQKLLKRNDA